MSQILFNTDVTIMDIAIMSAPPFTVNFLIKKVLVMFPPLFPLVGFASTNNSNEKSP